MPFNGHFFHVSVPSSRAFIPPLYLILLITLYHFHHLRIHIHPLCAAFSTNNLEKKRQRRWRKPSLSLSIRITFDFVMSQIKRIPLRNIPERESEPILVDVVRAKSLQDFGVHETLSEDPRGYLRVIAVPEVLGPFIKSHQILRRENHPIAVSIIPAES